eukprot:3283338-Prymnesium_polylepis.2
MSGKEMLTKAYDMAVEANGAHMPGMDQECTLLTYEHSNLGLDYDDEAMRASFDEFLRVTPSDVHRVAFYVLGLEGRWLTALRPAAVGDEPRPKADLPLTTKVVAIRSRLAREPFSFHRYGHVFVVVTPWYNDYERVSAGTMRVMLTTLPRYESEMGSKAFGYLLPEFGHMFHDKEDDDFISLDDARAWHDQVLFRLKNRMPRDAEEDAESVHGHEEEESLADEKEEPLADEVDDAPPAFLPHRPPDEEEEPLADQVGGWWTRDIFNTMKRAREEQECCERELRRRFLQEES